MHKYVGPIAARYASIFIQFGVVAVVIRALNQDEAGQYFVIMGLVWATYFVAGVGLPDGAVRFVPALVAIDNEPQATSLLSRGFRYSLATVPIGAALSACALAAYSGACGPAILTGVWWASYGIIFVSAQAIVASGQGELGTAIFYSAANTGQLVVTVPLILLAGLDRLDTVLLATVAGTSLSAAVCLVVAWCRCGRRGVGQQPLREAWQQGATIAAGRVVQSCLLWSPVWVVSLTLGASDAALVGLASRLVSAVAAVIAAVRFSIRPSLARDAAQGNWRAIESHSSRIALFTTVLAVAALAVAVAAGDPLIAFLFGSSYRGAGIITALMLIGTVGESFGGPVDEVLRMSGHATEVIVLQTAVLVAGIGAQALAGWSGGLTALLMTYGLMFLLLYLVFIGRLWRLRGILVLPRLTN